MTSPLGREPGPADREFLIRLNQTAVELRGVALADSPEVSPYRATELAGDFQPSHQPFHRFFALPPMKGLGLGRIQKVGLSIGARSWLNQLVPWLNQLVLDAVAPERQR